MKNIFTSIFLVATLAVSAQTSNVLQFVDKAGNIVADGSTVSRSELVADPFGDSYISTGLFVKNTSAEAVRSRIVYQIETLDNGMFQICFPVNCIRQSATGAYTTSAGDIAAGETNDLQCEWFPTAYGVCKARLSIEILNGLNIKTADGPSVILSFNHADPAHIDLVGTDAEATASECFTLQGVRLSRTHKGISIVRMPNGKTSKVLTH